MTVLTGIYIIAAIIALLCISALTTAVQAYRSPPGLQHDRSRNNTWASLAIAILLAIWLYLPPFSIGAN